MFSSLRDMEVYRHEAVSRINFESCHSLTALTETGIGPFGTVKLLEADDGALSLVKGCGEFLRRVQIVHPTAMLLARAALSQQRAHYDGVASLITFVDALLRQAEFRLARGVHPRVIAAGFEDARAAALSLLDTLALPLPQARAELRDVAASAAQTRARVDVASVVLDAVGCVRTEGQQLDSDRIDVLQIQCLEESVRLVRGLVLAQGFRHELMPKRMEKVAVLALNVSLEAESTAVATYMPVANSDQRERMTLAERKFVDDKLRSIIELRSAIDGDFLLVNGRGIDGPSLDILSRANIAALRRVPKKSMMRLVYDCGCRVVNCVDDIEPDVLGYAGKVVEKDYKGEKYVFIDEVKEPKAVTIVICGMTKAVSALTEDAVRSGIGALKNAYKDDKILPGAGATEIALNVKLNEMKRDVKPKSRIGFEIFAEALLAIPRALIRNAGLDPSEILSEMLNEGESDLAGVDLDTGEIIDPTIFGIYDNYGVIRNIIQAAPLVASQLLLVDEIIQSDKEKKEEKEDEE